MVRWLTALSRQGVRSDVFLYLDMARWPMSYPHYRKKNWIKVAVLGGTVWRSATEETPLADLNGTIAALKPIAVLRHNSTPFCAARNCSCSKTFPRWWEQVAKNQECFRAVTAYERQEGFRYAWVSKIRSDYAFDQDGVGADVVLTAIQRGMTRGEGVDGGDRKSVV